uniref:cAMP responsive element binding protein 3 like 4 n=1 Tax=Labrus bergylta TaxID=56723 RepID=A0A3Q3GHD1_9LABR
MFYVLFLFLIILFLFPVLLSCCNAKFPPWGINKVYLYLLFGLAEPPPTHPSSADLSYDAKHSVSLSQTLNDSESEDVLHAVDPNEVFPTAPTADPSSESDSGISEDPVVESPPAAVATTVYQVVYDISSLGGVKTEPGQENMISIELGEEEQSERGNQVQSLPGLYPDLQLTEEEQKLLTQEGVAEERILKKDSRRRRKEYIDGWRQAAACSAQNKELQRTVEQLEKRQLRQLQTLIKQTVSKGAQTSTCLLIILVSLGLIIMPSFSPFKRLSSADDDYRPTGGQ